MSRLELKIPPLVLLLACGFFMWRISAWFPEWIVDVEFKNVASATLMILGFLPSVAVIVSFRKADTTLSPLHPVSSSSLVTTGIYRFSRNPIYVGLVLVLLGWGAYLSNPVSLVFVVVFIGYMNRFQIAPEERALESLFGSEFKSYKQRVRRWI